MFVNVYIGDYLGQEMDLCVVFIGFFHEHTSIAVCDYRLLIAYF